MSRNINLMPVQYRQRQREARWRRQFIACAAMAVAVIGALVSHARYGHGERRKAVNALTQRVTRLEAVRAEAMSIARQADAVAAQLEQYERLALPIDVSRVIATASHLMPDDLVLTGLHLQVEQRAESMSAMEELRNRVAKSKGHKGSEKRIVRVLVAELSGIGPENAEVAAFIERLEDHSLFGKTQLDYDRTKVLDHGLIREFRVRFEIDLERRYADAETLEDVRFASSDEPAEPVGATPPSSEGLETAPDAASTPGEGKEPSDG